MSILTAFAIMGLVLLGIVLLCLGVTRMEKTAKSSEYDERQQLVRGRGYRLAFWVGFVNLLIMMPLITAQVEGKMYVEQSLLLLGGFVIQNLVFHVYCLINHAELPLSRNPVGTIIGYLLLGIMNLICSFLLIGQWTVEITGADCASWGNLMVAFTFLSMAALQLIQLLRREKE